MARQALHNVTNVLPILIPQRGEDSEGWVALPSGVLQSVSYAPEKPSALGPKFRRLANALSLLREAISLRDAKHLAEAIKASAEWVPGPHLGPFTYDFGKPLSQLIAAAKSDYSTLANYALRDTRTVIWCAHNGTRPLLPALFCPDEQTAVLAQTTLSPSAVRLCADPRCRVPFTPSNRRQVYHSPACRVRALRTRRS
jgi:hypothetical protein